MADLSAQLYGAPVAQTSTIKPSAHFSPDSNLDIFNRLPDDVKPLINSMVEGRMPVSGRQALSRPMMDQLVRVANEVDPRFDAATFNARNKTMQDYSAAGVSGKKFQALGTAMNHMQNYEKNYLKLDNSNWPINTIANTIESNIGLDTFNPLRSALAGTQADITTLAPELATAFRTGGGMAEEDIKNAAKLLDINAAPSIAKGSATEIVKQLEGKFQPMVDAYNTTMGTNKTVSDFLKPGPKAIFDRYSANQFGDIAESPKLLKPPMTATSQKKTVKWSDLK